MFGWFRPICPCDPAAKPWVEDRLRWLTGQFGLHVLLEAPVILPTEEFFPDPWDGSPKAAQRMFRRICEYMGVDSDSVELPKLTTTSAGQDLARCRPVCLIDERLYHFNLDIFSTI